MTATVHATMPSPVGEILLVARGDALAGLYLDPDVDVPAEIGSRDDDHPVLAATRAQLEAYFAGRQRTFDVPLTATGTAFQRRVWDELGRIPYGETISYRELARRIGQPAAVRAVGAANGRNPISIIVPCHRVIGANGALVGYGGGLERKRALLALESAEGRLL